MAVSKLGSTAKGAGQGAVIGGLLGPAGSLIGAGIGGIKGYMEGDAETQAEEANLALSAQKKADLEGVQEFRERLRGEAVSGADIAAQRAEENYQQLMRDQRGVEAAFGEAAGAAERGGQVATTGARQQAAAALRATAGGLGGGGAKAAQLGSTGMQLGQQLGQTLSDAARAKAAVELQGAQSKYALTGATGQAGVEAGAQKIEAAKTKKEAGTAGTDYQQKIRDYQNQINNIKASKKGGLGGLLPDDEAGAANDIRALAAAEEDPQVKSWLEKQAAAAESDI